MLRRIAQRCAPLEWSVAIVGAAILTCAFQGCAATPKAAEPPNAGVKPSGMSELGAVPEPAAVPTAPLAVEGSPSATLVSSTTLPSTEPSGSSALAANVESSDCEGYLKAQEPLARLGVAALSMGRIDPWIYDLDPNTHKLQMSTSLGGVPAPAATAFKKALKAVNGQPHAAKLLAQAYSDLTQPGSILLCTPTKYDVAMKPISHSGTGAAGYTWQFAGERRPSDVQMVGCFQALYAKAPDACDTASHVEQRAQCVTTHMGRFEDNCESPAEAAVAAERSAGAAPGTAHAAALKHKCCDSCAQTYRENSDGTCSSRSCF